MNYLYICNPKKEEFSSQVYEEINIELVGRMQNRSSPHNGAEDEAEREAQQYSLVGTSNKKEKQQRNIINTNAPRHLNVFEVYAEISKMYLITASQV